MTSYVNSLLCRQSYAMHIVTKRLRLKSRSFCYNVAMQLQRSTKNRKYYGKKAQECRILHAWSQIFLTVVTVMLGLSQPP